MKPKVIPTIILLSILFVVFFIIYLKFYSESKNIFNTRIERSQNICGKYNVVKIKVAQAAFTVDIADDECKRNLGLSGRTAQSKQEMFFVFENVGNYGFWMNNMNFPIDILWISDSFKVIGMEKYVFPDTYPKSFGEEYLTKYVLEIPAGYSAKYNIKVGDKINFTKN